jgi:RimJ/RimL family protein N-acetyltransferase
MTDPLSRYPRTLPGGYQVRPLRAEHEAGLVDFFRRMPLEELQLFKDDVRRPETIRGWIQHLDYANILPLLAFDGGRVVADATLHRDKRGWSRHVGKIRVSIDPDHRGKGLARALVREFLDLAPVLSLGILHAEILDLQRHAQALFDSLDFVQVATLPQQAIDLEGRVHDVLIYSCTVVPPARMAAAVALGEGEADLGGG